MNESKTNKISVDTEHIFPIIKKWLYSEKDIFLREIISNATDAITKLKRLESLGEYKGELPDPKITVTLDKIAKTVTVSDNGIGMTEEEIKKYIGQIALSGAAEFIQKYEGENGASEGIIGHFGLGFYSSFIVSDRVEVLSKSYTDAPSVHWICNENGEYEQKESDKASFGTDIIMHITEDEKEYLDSNKIKDMLTHYCSFMSYPIYFVNKDDEKESTEPINQTPLWVKNPSDCTDEEYKEFYHKVFKDFKDPLFYIHINADYPLNFKGILYFPQINTEVESIEGQIKLYYNQVFVSDNIKEIIPDYLVMMKGVLDCPELPLNVSRSYLQTNTYVSKLSAHIVKKVADKLISLNNTDFEEYSKIWENIKIFVEYACMRDRKFYDRVKDAIIFNTSNGEYKHISDFVKEDGETKIYYANDVDLHSQYINILKSKNIDVILLDKALDLQFISLLEQYIGKIKFVRVDAALNDELKNEGNVDVEQNLKDLFSNVVNKEKTEISFEKLNTDEIPAILYLSEEERRMEEMMKMYNVNGMSFPSVSKEKFVVNLSSSVVKHIEELLAQNNLEKATAVADHIYKLALIAQRKLTAEEMNEFLNNSYDILKSI